MDDCKARSSQCLKDLSKAVCALATDDQTSARLLLNLCVRDLMTSATGMYCYFKKTWERKPFILWSTLPIMWNKISYAMAHLFTRKYKCHIGYSFETIIYLVYITLYSNLFVKMDPSVVTSQPL